MPTKTKKKSPTVQVVISTFDDSYNRDTYRPIRNSNITDYISVTDTDYIPSGGTPLRDATAEFIAHLDSLKGKGAVVIGCLIDESGSMYSNQKSVIDGINEFVGGMTDIDVDPESDGKVLAVIFTDGLENASREVSNSQLQDIIKNKEKEDWTFIYLGANQDAWSTGSEYGFSGGASGQTVDFVSSERGTSTAMAYAGNSAQSFLADNNTYMAKAATTSRATLADDVGTVIGTYGPGVEPELWSPDKINKPKYNIKSVTDKAKEVIK